MKLGSRDNLNKIAVLASAMFCLPLDSDSSFSKQHATDLSPKTDFQTIERIEKLVLEHPRLTKPRDFIASIYQIAESPNFFLRDCTREDFIQQLLSVVENPVGNNYQGARPTCGAVSVLNALADYSPETLVAIAAQAVTSNSISIISPKGQTISLEIPRDCFKADDSGRTPCLRVLQSVLMEYLNGADLQYSNQNAYHYDDLGPKGRGVKMSQMKQCLEEILGIELVLKEMPREREELLQLNKSLDSGPVIVSFNWKKISEDELTRRVLEHGVDSSTYLSDAGYTGHVLYYKQFDGDHVQFDSTWQSERHSKFISSKTIGSATTPVATYNFENGYIAMDPKSYSLEENV